MLCAFVLRGWPPAAGHFSRVAALLPTVAPAPPPTSAPAAQAPLAASADTLPAQSPSTPTEVIPMQDTPTPLDTQAPLPPDPTCPARTRSRRRPRLASWFSRRRRSRESPPSLRLPRQMASSSHDRSARRSQLWWMSSRADLAQRQSVPLEDVVLVEIWTVVWSNRGLGCPDPNMGYPEVPADGLLIRLGIGERTYDYHTDGIKPPFLCDQKRPAPPLAPAAPLAPAPAGTVALTDLVPPPGNP